jgi:hypothetical protein
MAKAKECSRGAGPYFTGFLRCMNDFGDQNAPVAFCAAGFFLAKKSSEDATAEARRE